MRVRVRVGLRVRIRVRVSASVRVRVKVRVWVWVSVRVWVRGLPGGRAWRPPDHTQATSLPVPVKSTTNGACEKHH